MAKFFGEIGYGFATETPSGSGVFQDVITERSYFGDVVQNIRRLQETEFVNNDINVTNSLSIVADEYLNENSQAIRYVRWSGQLWKVQSVTVERPRLILRLGGIYNGPTPPTP